MHHNSWKLTVVFNKSTNGMSPLVVALKTHTLREVSLSSEHSSTCVDSPVVIHICLARRLSILPDDHFAPPASRKPLHLELWLGHWILRGLSSRRDGRHHFSWLSLRRLDRNLQGGAQVNWQLIHYRMSCLLKMNFTSTEKRYGGPRLLYSRNLHPGAFSFVKNGGAAN